MKRAGLALALACLVACGEDAEPVARGAPPYELRPVVAAAIERLERELAEGERGRGAAPEIEDLEPRVAGLVATLASARDQMRRVALEDLAQLGAAAVPPLAERLTDGAAPAAQRRAAAEALAAIDSPEAAGALLERLELARVEVDPDPWIRAQCAWRIGETSQDWVVPRLLEALRYEKDHETSVWIASSLARFANFAGLEALFVVAEKGPAPEVRAEAAGVLARLALEHDVAEAGEILESWRSGDPDGRLPPDEPSLRHRLEIWRRIAALAEWQLRGVDDARFVLARERSTAAGFLGQALRDENRYVRVHSAQCLERMGPRGRAAGPALVAALDDPEVAPQAAAALASIESREAAPELVARLDPAHAIDLRVAAARALGHLEATSAVPLLEPLVAEAHPLDLRAAAAASLLRLDPTGDHPAAVPLLADLLATARVEPTLAEEALAHWLRLRAAAALPGAAGLLDRWNAVPPDDSRLRQLARAALLRED